MIDKITTHLRNIPTWFSQSLNFWLLWGNPDLTISAAAYIRQDWTMKLIDWLFFWESDHCYKSFLKDVSFATMVLDEHLKAPTYRAAIIIRFEVFGSRTPFV